MDSGLTVKWDDRLHPSQRHFDRMAELGIPKESVTPNLSKFTSEVMKVYSNVFSFINVQQPLLLEAVLLMLLKV